MNRSKEFFKVVRCGSYEELVANLNFYLSQGWFLEDQDVMRTEFFQEFVAVFVSKDYLKHQNKHLEIVKGKKQKASSKYSLYLQK